MSSQTNNKVAQRENFRLDASRAFLCLYKYVRKGDGVEKQSEVKIYAKQESKTLNL